MTTELFEDAWFMDLPAKYKLFWIYLLTKCNNSGIWQVNWKLAQFYVGDNLEPTEVKRVFADRVKEFEGGKYWFIPKFIQFQYGERLSKSNPATSGVIKSLEDFNLLEFIPKTKIYKGASKELPSPLQGAQDKDKDKEKDKDKVKYKDEMLGIFLDFKPLHNMLEANTWIEWVEYRMDIKKKLTPRSAKMQLKFLSEQPNPVKCIEQSIQNQWQGLFEERNNGTNKSSIGATPQELAGIVAKHFNRNKN